MGRGHPIILLLSRSISLHARNMVWSNSEGTFERYESSTVDAGKIQKVESLDLAVSGAQGVSLGAASTVVDLLLKLFALLRFFKTGKAPFDTEVFLEGTPCYRIKGIEPRTGRPCELLIGKKDLAEEILSRDGHWGTSLSKCAETYE